MAEDNMTNIVNNLKNMLKNSDSNNNFNINPEIINNLTNMLQSNQTSNDSSASSVQNNSSSERNDSRDDSSIDFETILKMKSVFETLNQKDDPRSNLLYSLKPYLRENRQKKLDQYVNLLKITKVTNLFKTEKGDEN